jgi:hypothetical protein
MGLTRSAIFLAGLAWIASCGGSTTPGDGGAYGAADAGADTTVDDAPAADVDSMSCEEKSRAASALVFAAEMQDGTDLSCQSSDDCRIVWRITECSDNCSTLTTRTIEEKIKAAIEEANRTICPGFRAAGCRLIIPPCNPSLPPVCREGMCSAMAQSSEISSAESSP